MPILQKTQKLYYFSKKSLYKINIFVFTMEQESENNNNNLLTRNILRNSYTKHIEKKLLIVEAQNKLNNYIYYEVEV